MQKYDPSATAIQGTKKITVGFKCDPSLKAKLSKDAQQLDISLSEYVESVISNHYEDDKASNKLAIVKQDIQILNPDLPKKTCFSDLESRLTTLMEEQLSPVLISIEEIRELMLNIGESNEALVQDDNPELIAENQTLKKELGAIANNDALQGLFKKYKGKVLKYQTSAGEVRKITVTAYSDVITALVETIIDKP